MTTKLDISFLYKDSDFLAHEYHANMNLEKANDTTVKSSRYRIKKIILKVAFRIY